MSRFVSWFREQSDPGVSHHVCAFWQAILHVGAIYGIARYCTPRLEEWAYNTIVPMLLGRSPSISSWQFFFSHLFAFSFVPGLIGGFVNAKLFRDPIVRFAWAIPVAVLALVFVFEGPGIYPTMILDSDFRKAFHYFFGGDFVIPNDMIRGWYQFRFAVPAYAGVAYSLGAWLSICVKTPRPKPLVDDRAPR